MNRTDMEIIASREEEIERLSGFVQEYGKKRLNLRILEAGCGRRWELNIRDIDYTLVGVDIDKNALDIRRNKVKDLDEVVVGDLCQIDLPHEAFDIVYCSFVLEHVNGVQKILSKFVRWIKPEGLIIIRVPDRSSVFGFVTRLTPLWFHVMYRRVLDGRKQAGTPGYGPYPTVYDSVLTPEGFRDFSLNHELEILGEYGTATFLTKRTLGARAERIASTVLGTLSLGRLASSHSGLAYVFRKPAGSALPGRKSARRGAGGH